MTLTLFEMLESSTPDNKPFESYKNFPNRSSFVMCSVCKVFINMTLFAVFKIHCLNNTFEL